MPEDKVQKFADDQVGKMGDMCDTIRAIHGDRTSGRMLLIANMINHTTEVNATMVAMFSAAAENMEPDILIRGLTVVTDLTLRNKAICRATFDRLFDTEPELHKEMIPFFKEMTEMMSKVVRQLATDN